jgi:aspartyl-tRNA synthetase
LQFRAGAALSRKDIDDLTTWVGQDFGAKGLAWMKHEEDGLKSVVSKFFTPEQLAELAKRMGTKVGDIIFFAGDRPHIVHNTLGNLRLRLAKQFYLIPDEYNFVWVRDFPLFERDPDTKALYSVHHPFTAPRPEDLPILKDPERFQKEGDKILSRAYDLVLNGTELGGGSIRIHDMETQKAVLAVLGIGEEEARHKFGFLLEALEYGAPPHGGVAFGIDPSSHASAWKIVHPGRNCISQDTERHMPSVGLSLHGAHGTTQRAADQVPCRTAG